MTTTIDPALGNGPFTQQGVGSSPGYDAIDVRRLTTDPGLGEGVTSYGSFRVSQRGAGATMSVDINMDDFAYVRGDAITHQGLYKVAPHQATINETIGAADGSNPRIDRVVLEVKDHEHDASGSSLAQVRVVAGTATSGATLDNLTGAAAVPSSALLLADVLVAASDTSITDAEIRDRRPFVAGVPPLLTNVEMAVLECPYLPLVGPDTANDISHSAHDLEQAACLVVLRKRIVSATRLRWVYQHGSTALTGNYALTIYDASGRLIVGTGAVAFTGATSSRQERSETITATTFEPGAYYLHLGVDTGTGSAGVTGPKSDATVGGAAADLAPFANVLLGVGSGGTTAPSTLLSMSDAASSGLGVPKLPLVALSVG